MSDPREAVRHYVQFLREREGVREIRLTKAAREGLRRLTAETQAAPPTAPAKTSAPVPRAPVTPSIKPPAAKAPPAKLPSAGVVSWPPGPGPVVTELPVVEITGGTKVEQLRHLQERASVCVKCAHLAARRHTVVFGVGNPEAKLMFVGEGPGEEE